MCRIRADAGEPMKGPLLLRPTNPVTFGCVVRIVELSVSGIFQRFLMQKISRVARVAAVCAFALSALALGVAPADAATSSPAGPPPASGSAVPNGFNGTATITYADTSDFQVYIIDGESTCQDTGGQPTTGILGTIGVDSPAPASPFTVTTETIVGPSATALGSGDFVFCLYDETESWTLLEFPIVIFIFDPVTSSLTDNGKGSLVLTYENLNTVFNQTVFLFLYTNLTTCPSAFSLSLPGFGWQPDYNLTASPFVVGVGTLGIPFPVVSEIVIPESAPVTAGSYVACTYLPSTETGDIELSQSLLVSIYTPSEPVVPAFTG